MDSVSVYGMADLSIVESVSVFEEIADLAIVESSCWSLCI